MFLVTEAQESLDLTMEERWTAPLGRSKDTREAANSANNLLT